ATARAWKNLRLALRPSVGTCLSAASRKSAARRDTLAPFGILGKLGKLSIRFGKLSAPTSDPFGSNEELEGSSGTGTMIFSPVPVAVFRGRYRRDLASWRFHPATLMLPSKPQYANKSGRLHFLLPSSTQNMTHSQGSRLPRHHLVHMRINPPIMRTDPTYNPAPRPRVG